MKMYKILSIGAVLIGAAIHCAAALGQSHILLEAESFETRGGWVIDQQFFDILGSSYLLAHGMGVPVADASTSVTIEAPGAYHVWVRTKDWAPFPVGPGTFKVSIGDETLNPEFGSSGSEDWRWYNGGAVQLDQGNVPVRLHDRTGFEGRCDAIVLTLDANFNPPNDKESLDMWRKQMLPQLKETRNAGNFDIVVIGGGIAGITTAVQSARLGLKVALIQNRPVLGGNNSSEVRVHLKGSLSQNHYPKLGRIVRELDNGDPENANPDAEAYGDGRKLQVVRAEENIDLYLSTHAHAVEMVGDRISAVLARNIETNEEYRFYGKLFADCTGDGTIGHLAGADYRMGRESKADTGESLAVDEPDDFTMGFSNLWNAIQEPVPSNFPETPWALPFTEEYHLDAVMSNARWESGFGNLDPIHEAERIRDHNFRAIYGNWSYLKNHKEEIYAYWKLNWVAYIAGKRESRRLLGDIILQQQDIENQVTYEDGFVTSTWPIDLHYPDSVNSQYYPGQEFRSQFIHPRIKPYPIPFRCLYSRNIGNLMMAGRNISVTHVALGTVRVMRTTGMMGEVLGHAAYLCVVHDTTPRGVYQDHLDELKLMLKEEPVNYLHIINK